MSQRRLDITLVNLGAGFDSTSQLTDISRVNIFQRFAALISGYGEAKYQVWEKGEGSFEF